MVRLLCVGLAAAVCLDGAAVAADLSMTPIYKSRPSATSTLDGRLKSEYQAFSFVSRPPVNAAAGAITTLHWPMNDRAVRAVMGGRF